MDIISYLRQKKGIALSAEQSAGVTYDGAALLLAVPGAGKTTVLTARAARLMLNDGVRPRQMRVLTFSREAAKDMAARFDFLFGELLRDAPAFSTIHAFCYGLMRRAAGESGLPELITDGRQTEIFRGLYKDSTGRYGDDDLIDNMRRCCGLVANLMEEPSREHDKLFNLSGFAALCRGYADYKAREGFMDFDDMLMGALEILRGSPKTKETLRKSAPYVMVDEMQDTSALQQEIIKEIAAPDKLFLVGDEDQSIYAFRGASARLMLELPRHYPDMAVLKMQESFRLTPQVCEGADRLIKLNGERYDKTMVTSRPDGPEISYKQIPQGESQGGFIAQQLSTLTAGETAAVLYRNNPSAFGIADALDLAGIDFYIKEQKIRLKNIGIVADLIAFFVLSANPGDREAFGRIYYKMGAYVSRQMSEWALKNTPPGGDLLSVVCDCPAENISTARVLYAKSQIARLIKLPAPKALRVILDDLSYLDFLTSRAGGGARLEQDAQMLDAMQAMALRYPQTEHFLSRLDRLDDLLAEHADNKHKAAVTLSTIHSVKGMEFDRVYLADFLDGVFPSAQAIKEGSLGNHGALSEEVRLGYVAVTRARQSLTLLCPGVIGDRQLAPSRFIPVILGNAKDAPRPHELSGQCIGHRFFGSGVITSVDEAAECFTVDFGKLGQKTLHLSVVDKPGIVSFVD